MSIPERILVAGGAGFIGQSLVRAILARYSETEVIIIDNGTHATAKFLDRITSDRLIWYRCDIRQYDAVARVFKERSLDTVINLAARAGVNDSILDPRTNFEANVIGHFNLLDLARTHDVRHFLLASTGGAIIGEGQPPLKEDMTPNPLSPYGVSKLVAELYGRIFERCYDVNVCCLRFSNVYGEYSIHKSNLIPTFIRHAFSGSAAQLFGDGTQERDFIYVGDLVEGICRVLERESRGIIQLATGQRTSAKELVQLIGEVLPGDKSLNFEFRASRKGEVYKTWCDNTKSIELLGQYIQTSLETGLKRTVDWYDTHYMPGTDP